VVGLALAPRAAAGYERVHTLRWTQPAGATAEGFSVALGSASGQYGETRDLGSIAPASDGVHRADLVIDSFADYFVVLTAYNSAGSSPTSNELVVAKAACDETFCEDGNACTADACGATACSHEALPNGTACSGSAGSGLCSAGTCQPVECLAHADCGDGNACNGVEVCAGSRCQAGAAPSCSGETACTVSGCDATLGCVTQNKPDGTSCNDGNATTTADRCTAGVCAGTPETSSGGGHGSGPARSDRRRGAWRTETPARRTAAPRAPAPRGPPRTAPPATTATRRRWPTCARPAPAAAPPTWSGRPSAKA
jgi:hypothetical protein